MQAKRFWPVAALLAGWLFLAGCGTKIPPATVALPPVAPPAKTNAVFLPAKLAEMDAAIEQAIAGRKCPGGVLWLEHQGVAYHRAYGQRAVIPQPEPMTEDTIFDLASLTKVIATTPAVMQLVERGQIRLDAPVCTYLPEFTGGGKETVTIRELMTHTSGLRPDLSRNPDWTGYDTAIKKACAETLIHPPGTAFVYSDINFFLLGEIVRRVSGRPLDVYTAEEIFGPLKMTDTGFNPPKSKLPRIAPTEVVNGVPFRGVVHDPTARRMGGVAGHAGLFTTASDLARFCRMLLNGGELDGVRVLKAETVKLMTSVQTPPAVAARRGLGWDIDSPYAGERGDLFPLGGYGHTGWTGGSVWMDPFSRTFLIFLSNRNHPSESGNVLPLRHRLATLAAEAVIGFDFQNVPGALPPRTNATAANHHPAATNAVLNGIDVLAREHFAPLRGLRVGLITNHTGRDREDRATIDLLKAAPDVRLVALFSPEHGLRGVRDEQIGDSVDARTGLPVYSLYGARRQPAPEQLRGLDALVFDIQDIGCRFYTYIATMGLSMEAAAGAGVKFFVLDRVNPIGGVAVDGPVYAGKSAFTAFHALPVRHGMTVGELARMFNAERGWKCDLTVVPVAGWTRTMGFDQTGLPWTNPSPNIRSLAAATLYPGVGLLETTALSVGRGTDTPFEVLGAPYIDAEAFAAELNRAGLPGVRFEPAHFTPTASVFKGQPCAGVRIQLTDRDRCDAVGLGIVLAQKLRRLYPQSFNLEKMNVLLQDPPTLDAIRAGKSLAEIRAQWAAGLEEFRQRRAKFLLYP